MDIGAVVLHKILSEKSLDAWSKVKLAYFSSAYASIYSAVNRHYVKFGHLPNFEELDLLTRDQNLKRSLASLHTLEVPDVDIDSCIIALINQFAQNETLRLLNKLVDKISILDSEELKEELANIMLILDEKTLPTDKVYTATELNIFQSDSQQAHDNFSLGINNTWDSALGGVFRQDLVMVGGKRGSGKSIVCSNVVCNQYEMGNTAVYFSIEMKAQEVNMRNIGIMAGVPAMSIKKQEFSDQEIERMAKVKAGMFLESDDVFNRFLEHRDRFKFEDELNKLDKKPDNQIIIIDDRELTLASIDLHLSKLKAQFGAKLTTAVVDYANQVRISGVSDMYDWKVQTTLTKELKNLARKHDLLILSPLQTDDNNSVRYAKGLLDAPDLFFTLDMHSKDDGAITFDSAKVRSGPDVSFTSEIDWLTLKIHPRDKVVVKKEKPKKGSKSSDEPVEKSDENANDVPW